MIMQDQKDPDQFYTLVVFQNEEKARARERDPRRREGLQVLRAMLADRLAGPLLVKQRPMYSRPTRQGS
jgi:hypothetical protein